MDAKPQVTTVGYLQLQDSVPPASSTEYEQEPIPSANDELAWVVKNVFVPRQGMGHERDVFRWK